MISKPQDEHRWLERFLGEWTVESEASFNPDQPSKKSSAPMTCRSLAGMWIMMESIGTSEEHGAWSTVLTLGYDADRATYVGTFVGSMMSFLWIYSSGSLDPSGRILTLVSEGPNFDQSSMAKYHDILEIIDDDYWTLSSQIETEQGWQHFMTAHHRRKGSR